MRIRFLVSGGARLGLGHVMRTAVLAAEARRQGHAVTMVVRGDAAAHAALAAELPGAPIESWRDAAAAVSAGGPILIDSPEDISVELSTARRRGVRSVVVDRTDHLDHADATVLPVLHGPAIAHPRLFQGAEFVAVAPVVRSAEVPAYPAGRSIALVTAGGADPVGLTSSLTETLLAALDSQDALPVHVVIGPAFASADALVRRLPACAQVHRALPRPRLAELMARARFALSGFGTTVYDLAVLGTPVVYWTHRPGDLEDARRLEARGLGACGGDGTIIRRDDVAAVLARTVLGDSWCLDASARGRALVGPANGAAAVVRLLAGDESERS